MKEEKKYTSHLHGNPLVYLPETSLFLENRKLASKGDREEISKLRNLLPEIQSIIDSYPDGVLWESAKPFKWDNPYSSFCTKTHVDEEDGLNVYRWSNGLLCHIFNKFPTHLDHANGIVEEVPEVSPTGIRPVLYHMLRLEYTNPRKLRSCANEACGGYFALERRNRKYCSGLCKNNKNQRDHTDRAHQNTARARRKTGPSSRSKRKTEAG